MLHTDIQTDRQTHIQNLRRKLPKMFFVTLTLIISNNIKQNKTKDTQKSKTFLNTGQQLIQAVKTILPTPAVNMHI